MFAAKSLTPARMIRAENNPMEICKWYIPFVLVLAAVPAPAVGAEAYIAEETLSRSFDASVSPRIVVETFNGGIAVSAEPGRTITATVTRRGSGDTPEAARADLDNVEVTMEQTGNTTRIAARRIVSPPGTYSGASVELAVPVRASLEAVTTNGSVVSAGVTGDVRVVSSNGSIDVTGGKGRLNLRTSNGPIRIEASNAAVSASTSNARIDFKGTMSDGEHVLRTLNGPIEITLPADAQFKINASSWNGRVSSAFRVKRNGSMSNSSVHGTVGDSPAIAITAEAVNGDVVINRAK